MTDDSFWQALMPETSDRGDGEQDDEEDQGEGWQGEEDG